MSESVSSQLVLLLYALIAVGVIGWQIARTPEGWGAWVLYVIQRLYGGLLYHWRANRRCPFPNNGPGIVIANHRSPVDPLMIWTNHHLGPEGTRRPRVIGFLMAREYYEQRGLIGWICHQVQSIPVDRNGRDVRGAKLALRRLRDGHLVGIFPEGRINRGTGLLDADVGVAWLALTSHVPVYPVFIKNTPQGENMVAPFYTPSRVYVIYGDPIDLSAYFGKRKTSKLLEEVTQLLMKRLAELGGVDAPP